MFFLVLRITVAAILAISGCAKLFSREKTEHAASEIGLGEHISRYVSIVLPVVELIISCLLIMTPTASAGVALAMALLTILTAVVIVSLLRGRKPSCSCFGPLSTSRPIGMHTLVRNGAILAVLGILAFGWTEKISMLHGVLQPSQPRHLRMDFLRYGLCRWRGMLGFLPRLRSLGWQIERPRSCTRGPHSIHSTSTQDSAKPSIDKSISNARGTRQIERSDWRRQYGRIMEHDSRDYVHIFVGILSSMRRNQTSS